MMRRLTLPAFVLLSCLTAATGLHAAGKDLAIAAFFGTFTGGGVAQNRDSLFFGVTARDFDVTIRPAPGGGFRIDWTSVIRKGGSPEKPDVRRKSTNKTLTPTGTPGSWRCKDSTDPLEGGELCWARIKGNTLSLFLLTVGSDGSYVLQQYDRTVSDTGMKLVFTSHQDGRQVRTVTGHLVMSAR